MANIDTMKDSGGVETYPKTVTSAVYDKTTNERLDNTLASCVKSTVGQNLKIWYGTIVEYKAIATKDANTLYFIKEVIDPNSLKRRIKYGRLDFEWRGCSFN